MIPPLPIGPAIWVGNELALALAIPHEAPCFVVPSEASRPAVGVEADADRAADEGEHTAKMTVNLADPGKGLRYDETSNTLWLSSIFKWYAGDFTGGSTVVAFFARGKVLEWVLPYVSDELRDTLVERQPSVRYLDYDWSLNDR